MIRRWTLQVAPKFERNGFYREPWMRDMDRYRISEDGYAVMSRLLDTKFGLIEHVYIHNQEGLEITKQAEREILKDLFAIENVVIEIKERRDNQPEEDVHLWVLLENDKLPFGKTNVFGKRYRVVDRGEKRDVNSFLQKMVKVLQIE